MSLTVLGSRKGRLDRSWRVRGAFQWSTTDLTGYLPIDSDCPVLSGPPLIWPIQPVNSASGLGGTLDSLEYGAGTAAASANFEMVAPRAGVITAAKLTVHTTVATDDTNFWSVGVVNVTQTLTAVDGTAAANSNKATGGSAFTAVTPRALTLGSAANCAVAAGDAVEWTFTKTASAVNLVALELLLQITTTAGVVETERVFADCTGLIQTSGYSAGLIVPTIITSITPASLAIPVTRKGTPTSGLICGFSYDGGSTG